ncbi:RNB-domain-containing protein [Durotheca rogersii]|uniref:RNB-domain-containing protein n=1 Tax=Durotheca rogersii TaxID=419775 RepID=UPI00221E6836|nr:RNB-domain-containing protein [Durotheca rogersii]KAI5866873.1 RNB-domain-containing protein [Durotheca rogersii]
MWRVPNRSYICWRCASRSVAPDPVVSGSGARLLPRATQPLQIRALATVRDRVARGANSNQKQHAQNRKEKLNIRERLRIWDEENQDEAKLIISDFADMGEVSNSFTRPQNLSMGQFEITPPLFDGDELSDLRSDSANLGPGDMVELSSEGSRRPMLAIYLGRLNSYAHFYTSTGKWFTGLGVRSLFVVRRFIEPAELEPVIKELPSSSAPLAAINTLHDLGHNPSRTAGSRLLRKMVAFDQEAQYVYQANAATLDVSSSFIGDPVKHRYLTLHEIAEILLPASYQREGKFDPHALYAVHRALLQDEVFFRPLRHTGHKSSYLFEISPLSEVRIIKNVEKMIRAHLTRKPYSRKGAQEEPSPLDEFVYRARMRIDQSRQSRRWTNAGIIGSPIRPNSMPPAESHQWSGTDLEVLKFIELWAGYRKFPSYSRLQCFGSTLLRLVKRYEEAENLTASTGWTFLQEIGWIPPWEIPARYSIRFPDVEIQRGGGYIRPYDGNLDEHLREDILSPMRKVWDGITAYCIDAETTTDIDDGVSLERTSDPHQFWIHVHVADPASSVLPETVIAGYAELIPQTIYLPGHFERMLPDTFGQDKFSLAPNRRCLTFSALVDKDGVVLDRKITPGILKDVVYITSEDVATAIGETRALPTYRGPELTLGRIPEAQPAERPMMRHDNLSSDQKKELALLSELGNALHALRLSRGATPYYPPQPQAQVYFDDEIKRREEDHFGFGISHPSIHLSYTSDSGTDLVGNIMRLAGEVAAEWCHERGIPIPYRTQPHAAQNIAAVQQYIRDVFNPLLNAGARPDDNIWRQMWSLIGNDELSTTPGPHVTMGVSMYTKATSPLRRFSDLLVHWQVEAALIEENRRGTSLVGNKDDTFLPFTRAQLDRMLPLIRVREKQARALMNGDGKDQWILQALARAWEFKEAKIPKTFQFHVTHVNGRRSILGRLNWFERPATLRSETLNDILKMAHARIGDVYEVKIKNVNVHGTQIIVEAIRVIKKMEVDIFPATPKGAGEKMLEV